MKSSHALCCLFFLITFHFPNIYHFFFCCSVRLRRPSWCGCRCFPPLGKTPQSWSFRRCPAIDQTFKITLKRVKYVTRFFSLSNAIMHFLSIFSSVSGFECFSPTDSIQRWKWKGGILWHDWLAGLLSHDCLIIRCCQSMGGAYPSTHWLWKGFPLRPNIKQLKSNNWTGGKDTAYK